MEINLPEIEKREKIDLSQYNETPKGKIEETSREEKKDLREAIKISDDELELDSKNVGQSLKLVTDSSAMENPKLYNKYVRCIKRMVRGSEEYKFWVKYVKLDVGYDKCFLTDESLDDVSLELHHHPISLENIVKIVLDTNISNGNVFTTFDITKEVIKLHYMNKIGFVILVSTMHEKFHNGSLDIGMDIIKGDWNYLPSNKEYFISEDIERIIKKYKKIKTTEKQWLAYKSFRNSEQFKLLQNQPDDDKDDEGEE